ncbi:hypothetical protein [Bradyrhizobium sp. Ash2021]|uniref:hypothetical protein n=1 Tax=Bradyrhizobium sp. Ash2021 TaxID=2954771 RepID=UPI002815938D|nr:hypothetical protein [Bradyrhizobium sp. Ash2021]WMT72859.1 hypothetical protein NL528_33455 [Bradyrhizobium sp. Ash2021]
MSLAHIDTREIEANIEHTRFPVPEDEQHTSTADYPGLLRAADLIGQLADIDYLRKTSALFAEFQETGASEKLGYQTPDDLRAAYPAFFWQAVRPYIGDALRYLQVTQEGKQWIANLYAHVFSEEHRGHSGPTEVSLHTRAVCLRHLRYFGSFLTESACPRHVRFTPDSDCRADISVRQLRAKIGSPPNVIS